MQPIHTVDAHAAGEPCRVILGGVPELPGPTMAERRRTFRKNWDWVRTGLTHEPRGHSGMFGALLTPPVHDGSAYGLIFFDPVGYMDGCGHGTLCSIAVWQRMHGALQVPFRIDNPDDSITHVLRVAGDEEHCVVELGLPAARVLSDAVAWPGLNGGGGALVHCGNSFAIVEARAAGIEDLRIAGMAAVQEVALELRRSAQRLIAGPGASGLELLLYQEMPDSSRSFSVFVLFNGSQIDRSPCGTGSAALTALLLFRGVLSAGERIRTFGPAGGHFDLAGRGCTGDAAGFEIRLCGTAHITGVHEWIFSTADAFARGYLLA